MALVESVCVLTPQGCFLTFLLPRVDQGHDLEAFRKKMRVKCHIGHTGWLYGITCLAHLINVAYDFPVNWSQNPTCKLSSKETHKSSCAWVGCNLSSICVAFTNQAVAFTSANSHGETDWKLPVQGATKYHGDLLWIKFGPNLPRKRSTKNAVHSTGQLEAWLDQGFCACKVAAATISCHEDLRGSCPLTSLLEDHMEFREAKSYPKGWIIQHSLHQRGHIKIIVSNTHIATPSGPSLPFFFWMFEIFLKFILHTTSVEMCQSLCTSCGKYLYSISWYSSPANSLASGSQVHQTKCASKTWPAS